MPPGKPMLLSIQRLLDSLVPLLRKPSVRLPLQIALEGGRKMGRGELMEANCVGEKGSSDLRHPVHITRLRIQYS